MYRTYKQLSDDEKASLLYWMFYFTSTKKSHPELFGTSVWYDSFYAHLKSGEKSLKQKGILDKDHNPTYLAYRMLPVATAKKALKELREETIKIETERNELETKLQDLETKYLNLQETPASIPKPELLTPIAGYMPLSLSSFFEYVEKVVAKLHDGIRWKSFEKMNIEFEKLKEFLSCLKSYFPEDFVEPTFAYVDQHLHFVERYIKERDIDRVTWNFDDIKRRDLPNIKSKVYDFIESQKALDSGKEEKVYPKGHVYDFYKDIRDKTKDAKSEVFVIDSYVDEELLDLYLEKIPTGVKIKILTNKPKGNFVTVAQKFKVKPQVDFEVRVTKDCHDRLFFIDNQCWVMGQSIKDAGHKPTYLIKIEGHDLFRSVFDDLWKNASKLI